MGNDEGESVWIAFTPPMASIDALAVAAAQTFYMQKDSYDHTTEKIEPADFDDFDDYTQMIWASTEKVGIGIHQQCTPGQFLCVSYVVFRYSPKGIWHNHQKVLGINYTAYGILGRKLHD